MKLLFYTTSFILYLFIRINNTFNIAATVKDSDYRNYSFFIINKVIYNKVVYRHLMHFYRTPWFPLNQCIRAGMKSNERTFFVYVPAVQQQSPEQKVHSQYMNIFHVNHPLLLQNSQLYSYLSYTKLLCKCFINFICRIYLSGFYRSISFLKFCIKLFPSHCTNG